MDEDKYIAQNDNVLKELLSNNAFDGELCSSDEESDYTYQTEEPFDDIEEMMIREQIRGAKQLFKDITEPASSDEEEEEFKSEDFEEYSDVLYKDDDLLKPHSKLSEVMHCFETAMETNSRMRDRLLMLKGALLRKRQELEDSINDLEERDDLSPEETEEENKTVTWGFPGYLDLKGGVVFTNKIGLFGNQFLPPYFKDKYKFRCPQNLDTLEWEKKTAVSISSVEPSRHWSPQSIENLENAMKKALIEEFKSKADFKAIYRWREYSSFVKSHSLAETLKAKPPDYKFDWLKIALLLPPDESRTGAECSKLWDLYLSTKFSKEEWSDAEDNRIIELANKYDEQHWDKVAQELGTDRSPFQIFSYYQASLRKTRRMGEKWTHEEDEFIRNVVASCTYGDYISWKKIMYYCEKKSYIQVYNRWQNNLICRKKGKFSQREDRALITALAHGMGYRDTAKALGGQRSSQQIRDRLMAIVKFGRDNALNVGDWGVKEDSKLIGLIGEHGEKWSVIAKEMGTRDRTQCRHRYQRLKKRLSDNPNLDIKQMDRRKRKGYTQTLRTRKRNLLKMLRKGPMSQKKKKTFLSEVSNIMEEPNELFVATGPDIPNRHKAMYRFLAGRGSGYWHPFDHCKASAPEKQCIEDVSKVLGARLDYSLFDRTMEQDEHLKSVKELIPGFQESNVCDATTWDPSCSSASTSGGAQNVTLLPPNSITCYGFLQSLAYCSTNEKILRKWTERVPIESEEVRSAKEVFQRRLYQLFMWPAILSSKQKKDKIITYGEPNPSNFPTVT